MFGVAEDWKATALEADQMCRLRRSQRVGGGLWPRGRKGNAARHCQEERELVSS